MVVALDSKVDLFRQKMESDLQSLKETLDTLNDSVSNLSVCLQEHKEQTTAELAHLQTSLSSSQSSLANQTGQLSKLDDLPSKLDALNKNLCQHQQQTTAELDHLQTSLNSKLDTLNISLSHLKISLNTSLSQHQQQTTAELDNIQTSLNTKLDILNTSLAHHKTSLTTSISQHQQQTTAELAHLQTSLSSTQSSLANQTGQLSNKLDTLNTSLAHLKTSLTTSISQHQQQTTAELAHLQTSLISTNSKLDSLMATAAHLSSDHQEIQTNISDVQCMDTQQRLQDNLTHQLETIKDCIENQPVYSCGGTGGWRRVVYLDMTDSHTTCPSGWNMTGYSKRTCGRNSTGYYTCSSATFPVSGGEYSRVCGRIKAYQWGGTNAFYSYYIRKVTTIDGAYSSGVSVTHGTPQNHIWTFVAGASEGNPTWYEVCPCDSTSTIRIPPFVGNDYFCESGINENWFSGGPRFVLHSNDTLWDGEDCLPSSTCCSQHNLPYFTKQLPTTTTDDIEARICLSWPLPSANLAVELVELYVQ